MVRPLIFLRWSIGLVLGTQAGILLTHPAGHGVHPAVVGALASLEVLAALLVVVPATIVLGAALLLAVLVLAAALHALHGETPPPAYLIYAAALWVIAAHARERR
jgi:hypothetical protein